MTEAVLLLEGIPAEAVLFIVAWLLSLGSSR